MIQRKKAPAAMLGIKKQVVGAREKEDALEDGAIQITYSKNGIRVTLVRIGDL